MIEIINWNISYMGKAQDKIDAVKSIITKKEQVDKYVICLQEVTPNLYDAILLVPEFKNHVFSLNHRTPGKYEGRNRALGCLVIASENLKIKSSFLIDRSVFPERALVVEIECNNFDFQVICFHSLTGVGYRKAKSAHFAALADYLHLCLGKSTVLCCDLNEPKVDHIELADNVYFDQGGDTEKYAKLILNPDGIHNLEDSYRLFLQDNSSLYEKIKVRQATSEDLEYSPLALSHKVNNRYSKRYDYIMVSPEFKVQSIEYNYSKGREYGSDHAILRGVYKIKI